jgi:hypothetical protein
VVVNLVFEVIVKVACNLVRALGHPATTEPADDKIQYKWPAEVTEEFQRRFAERLGEGGGGPALIPGLILFADRVGLQRSGQCRIQHFVHDPVVFAQAVTDTEK